MTLVWLGALTWMRALGRTCGTALIVGEKEVGLGLTGGVGSAEGTWIVRTAAKSWERRYDSGCGASNKLERRSGRTESGADWGVVVE